MTTTQTIDIDYSAKFDPAKIDSAADLAIDFVLKRSWICSLFPSRSKWLISEAVEYIQREYTKQPYDDFREGIVLHLNQYVRQNLRYNPILAWILIKIVLPDLIWFTIGWLITKGIEWRRSR